MRYLSILILLLLGLSAARGQTRTSISDLSAVDMQGQTVDTSQMRGKIVVINLWFINCPNCLDEIKKLNQLVADYAGNKDVVFLGLAASKKADLQKFLVKNPFAYRIVPDASILILTKFGTPDKNGAINVPFPMHYVLDRTGKVLVREEGVKGVKAVRDELKKQLGG